MQVMDDAALKVLQAAEQTKQVLAEKEEVLTGIREEFERKSKEVTVLLAADTPCAEWQCGLHLGLVSGHLCVAASCKECKCQKG